MTKEQMFCPVCGKKQNQEPLQAGSRERFNTETGEEILRWVCRNLGRCDKACEDNGGHKYVDIDSWWTVNRRKKCSVCNDIVYGGFY